jgi:PST family polysaccharide transporter
MTLLPPTSFGLLGMVTVFSGFLSVFKDFGLGSSIIQRKDITNTDLDTVFWTTVALGIFLTILLIGLSPIIATYYEEPKLVNITIGLSFLFVIQSLSSIHLSLLKKKMNFKFLFQVKVTATLLAGITALVMAYLDYGVWALVIQQLLNATLLTLILFIFNNYTPKFQFEKKILNSHLKFSLPLVGRGSLNYWSRNADNFFIGKFLGAELLGIYTRSYSIMMLPVSRISGVISSVMFPSLAQIQDDGHRINSIFLKITRTIAFITFPLMAILCVGADSFIKLIFNETWYKMIPVLQVLSGVGAVQSIATLNGNIFMVKARTDLAFKLNILNSLCYVTTFYFTSQINLFTLTLVYLLVNILLLFINWFYLSRLMKIKMPNLIKNILFEIFGLLIMVGLGLYTFSYINTHYWIKLLLSIIYVCVFWSTYFALFNSAKLNELKSTIKSAMSK